MALIAGYSYLLCYLIWNINPGSLIRLTASQSEGRGYEPGSLEFVGIDVLNFISNLQGVCKIEENSEKTCTHLQINPRYAKTTFDPGILYLYCDTLIMKLFCKI